MSLFNKNDVKRVPFEALVTGTIRLGKRIEQDTSFERDILPSMIKLNKQLMEYYGYPLGYARFYKASKSRFKHGMYLSDKPFFVPVDRLEGLEIECDSPVITIYGVDYQECPLAIPYKVVKKYGLSGLGGLYLGNCILGKPKEAVKIICEDNLYDLYDGRDIDDENYFPSRLMTSLNLLPTIIGTHKRISIVVPAKYQIKYIEFSSTHDRGIYSIIINEDKSISYRHTYYEYGSRVYISTQISKGNYKKLSYIGEYIADTINSMGIGEVESISWCSARTLTLVEADLDIDVNIETGKLRVWVE